MKAAISIAAVPFLWLAGADAIAGGDPVDLGAASAAFWTDMDAVKQGKDWKALTGAVGLADASSAAMVKAQKDRRQAIVNVSLQDAQDTARFLDSAAAAGPGVDAAVTTALRMRATPGMVEAAEPMVAPEVRQAARRWRADLDHGIPGLPGIYLGAPAETGAGIATAPAGYQPMSSAAIGCHDQ